MRLRIHQINVKLDYEKRDILAAVAKLLKCREDELAHLTLLRRSIDARGHAEPRFALSVDVDYVGEAEPPFASGRVMLSPQDPTPPSRSTASRPNRRPVVVGAGPAGLLAALTLAEAGWNPLVIERGADVRVRRHQVETFWQEGTLDPESNVLYGEGGAGLFSDGKLTSRSKDRGAVRRLYDLLVACGASSDILIDAEPHLGSDALTHIIPALRKKISELGGEVRFHSALEGLHIENGELRGLCVSGTEIETDRCFLATGHSARDIYTSLVESDIALAAKPFAVGVRAEMPQSRLNVAQYGRWATHPKLRAASFRLTRKPGNTTRACYSFCTCPGGLVMACASSAGRLTTNGMSYSGRSKPFGNAAMLVPVGPDDFDSGGTHPALAGISYQEAIERAAFAAGGEDYSLPAQTFSDFLCNRPSVQLPDARSCTRAVPSNLVELLPEVIATTLQIVLPRMLKELNGIRPEDILLYGVETRSSSPVRIVRDPSTRQSPSLLGLYPIGEGSGYTGGIVSSALDGQTSATHAVTEGVA